MSTPWRPAFGFDLIDDTTIRVFAGIWEKAPEEWRALCEWCEAHGMDPNTMPVSQTIVRNLEARRVEYDQIQLDEHGRKVLSEIEHEVSVLRVFAQGETPPLPFPDVILRHLDHRPESA